MMRPHPECPACEIEMSRRRFLGRVGAATALALTAPTGLWTPLSAEEGTKKSPITLCGDLWNRMGKEQRDLLNYPVGHEIRKKVMPGWECSRVRVNKLKKVEQSLVTEILRASTSTDGYRRIAKAMQDDSGGLKNYSVAFLGKPGEKGFMFMLTGRHLTVKVDGNYKDKIAFGGPICYGHGEWIEEKDQAKKNVYYDHALKANKVFKALDDGQRKHVMHEHSPDELFLGLRTEGFWGMPVDGMTKSQQKLVLELIMQVGSMWAPGESTELGKIIEANGGIGKLHLACWTRDDVMKDKVWDVWRLEGPGFVWYFRGYPHVHAYIHAKALPKKKKPNKPQK